MEENNKIQKTKYTEEQVMKALMQMSPELKEALVSNSIANLMTIANDTEFAISVIKKGMEYVKSYKNGVKWILQFIELLSKQENDTENVVDTMAELYKGLSREERLEFNVKLAEISDLENSLDTFKYQWNKLVNKVRSIK